MTQHYPLNYSNTVHDGFFDPIQELLGTYTGLRIYVVNSTTLGITAGTGNSQVAVTIASGDSAEAGFRYITSNITASLPGGLTNGTGSVYVTASQNAFDEPDNQSDATVYSFALSILASGTPSTDLYRKVGEVDVVSSAITAFRPMGGPRTTSEFPLVATADNASQAGLTVKAASSQSANIVNVLNSSGTSLVSVTSTGKLVASTTDGVEIAGAGGNDTLNLSDTTSGTGITIGGDVTVYREGANELRTDDEVVSKRTATQAAFSTQVGTETYRRLSVAANGDVTIGTGSAAADLRLRRSGTKTLAIDDGNSGAAAVSITGTLATSGNVGFNGQSPASRPDYTVTNGTTDRTFNANSTTIDELADVVSTVIADLTSIGLFQ
jgi:hypothetical protein